MFLDMAPSVSLADVLRLVGGSIIVCSWLIAGHRMEMYLHSRAPGSVRPGFLAWAGLLVGLIVIAAASLT